MRTRGVDSHWQDITGCSYSIQTRWHVGFPMLWSAVHSFSLLLFCSWDMFSPPAPTQDTFLIRPRGKLVCTEHIAMVPLCKPVARISIPRALWFFFPVRARAGSRGRRLHELCRWKCLVLKLLSNEVPSGLTSEQEWNSPRRSGRKWTERISLCTRCGED